MISYGNNAPWLYSSCAPYDPPDLTPRGCFDLEVPSYPAPLATMIYGARHSPIFRNGLAGLGASDFDEQVASDREALQWSGKQHPLSGSFSARLAAAVQFARSGNDDRAAKAYADAEALLPEFGDASSEFYDEAQILLETAQRLFRSARSQVMEHRSLLAKREQELKQEAAEGSTAEAWDRELKERADIERAKEHGAWAYGLSALPGGSGLVEGIGAGKDFVQGPGKWIVGLIALGLGVYAVSQVKSIVRW